MLVRVCESSLGAGALCKNKPHGSLFRVSDRTQRAPTGCPLASVAVGREMRLDFSLSSAHRTLLHGVIAETSLAERKEPSHWVRVCTSYKVLTLHSGHGEESPCEL